MAAATLPPLSTLAASGTSPTSPLPRRTRADQPTSEPDTAETPPISGDATPDAAASQSPRALKDRAFDLYAHGFRSPAIATQLGISERTVRNWVQTTIQQLAEDDVTTNLDIARQQRALAIESQRAVAATAWTAYQQLSDAYTRLMSRALAPTNSQPERLLASSNRLAATAARHLTVVISANREIARLQGQAVAQATREQHAASQQATDDTADLLRILTMPIPTPSAHPSTLDALPSMHDITHTAIPATNDLPAPDFPPLPDHVIAAVMRRYREMEAAGKFDSDGLDIPITAETPATHPRSTLANQQEERSTTLAAPQTKIAAKTATPTIPIAATSVVSPLCTAAKEPGAHAQAPSKTKFAAKTATAMATQARPKNNHPPTIAIPSRAARKLRKKRT